MTFPMILIRRRCNNRRLNRNVFGRIVLPSIRAGVTRHKGAHLPLTRRRLQKRQYNHQETEDAKTIGSTRRNSKSKAAILRK
jgi:hypothetical protein